MRILGFIVYLAPIALGSCGGKPSIIVPGQRGNIGATVSVDAGKTVVGFARGVLRQTVDVATFKITKHPVTVKQYKECRKEGACAEPNFDECPASTLPASVMSGPDEAAALCVGYNNARAYCAYVGGNLPKLPQWLRAARGADVKAYPWGNKRASCAQHPRSYDFGLSERPDWVGKLSLDGCPSGEGDVLRVGQHAPGSSPYQVEDVLLASGELIEGESGILFNACDENRHCLVLSYFPGRIDTVSSYSVTSDAQAPENVSRPLAPAVWSFRCVVGG